ncbi:MAG TPA: hypothetical protein VH590_09490 [Ktedonobacterales bacterium]|jgi:hypothetical protein
MDQFAWLRERLADDALDNTIILTFSRSGSWMGMRVLERFSLSGGGSFRWEWEDVYAGVPYQQHALALDRQTTSGLFQLFQAGLPSLLAFHVAQPLPPLIPDTIPASFDIRGAGQRATYLYPLDTRHRSVVRATGEKAPERTIAPELKQLLNEFVRLRTESRASRDAQDQGQAGR